MKIFLLFICFILSNNIFSQEIAIATKFIDNGSIYESLDELSEPIADFKENDNCIVTKYWGKYTYQVKYKEWEGFVKDEFLVINEEMMDLFFDHEEKERAKVIAEKEARRKRIQKIINGGEDEINEKRKQDSIIRVKELEKLKLAEQENARRIADKINEERKRDSIIRVKELEKLKLAEQENARRIADKINEERKQDSIIRVKELEKLKLAEQENARRIADKINEERKQDSIIRVKELEKLKLAEQENARRIADEINEKRKQDSIIRVKELEKLKLAEQENARRIADEINEKRKQDSIIRVKELEKLKLEEQEHARIIAEKKNELRKLDSIIKVREAEKLKIETNESAKIVDVEKNDNSIRSIKDRNSCNYLIDEYDKFYNERIIKTESYRLSENLTIELNRKGRTMNVFFNLSEDLGCASYLPGNRSSVRVELENNQIITFYHSWNIECGNFNFKGKLSNAQIIKLEESPIKSIKLKGTKRSQEVTNLVYKEFFIDKLKCLE